jgi:prolyl-tRNA editing enzyme YbaK/EbsC (Cys-tRNA(Pro) deacylase)
MTAGWPEPVERVARFARETGAEVRIEEFAEETRTAVDAADAVGCSLAQIVKSLVLDCDARPVVALVPGDRRGDPRKIAAAVGAERARVSGPERVLAVTGFEAGAVAPFPLPDVERVLVDPSLLRYDRLWVGAGSHRHLASLPPAELVRLSRAEVVDVSGGSSNPAR